jgi:TetR/AcrR family transcriptional repressor of nem operon
MARPREFDEERVLKRAMELFWRKGFNGTSLSDLVHATGIKKASLYACYGNKEKLFKAALLQYASLGPFQNRKNSAIGTLVSFYELLVNEADLPKEKRRGCFVFNSCLELGNRPVRLAQFVIQLSENAERAFLKLLNEAQASGELSSDLDTTAAAKRTFATAFTIREMAKFKPDKAFLREIANMALSSIGTNARLAINLSPPVKK